MQLHPNAIVIPADRLRKLNPSAVARLAKSIAELGLQTPIDVRRTGDRYTLIAGLHRLEAVKQLGLARIECRELEEGSLTAKLWEIAENLHREELTIAERDEQIRLYVELRQQAIVQANAERARQAAKPSQDAKVSPQPDKGGRGKKGKVTEASEELGISKDIVRRALKPKPKPKRPSGLGPAQGPKRAGNPATGEPLSRGETYRIIMEICTMGKGSCTPEQVAEALGIEPANAEQHMREVAKLGFHQWQGRTLMYASPPMDALRTLFPHYDWQEPALLPEYDTDEEPRT
jgi:ParB-like nuclease domain